MSNVEKRLSSCHVVENNYIISIMRKSTTEHRQSVKTCLCRRNNTILMSEGIPDLRKRRSVNGIRGPLTYLSGSWCRVCPSVRNWSLILLCEHARGLCLRNTFPVMTSLTKYSALLPKKTSTRLLRLEKALATPKSNLCRCRPKCQKIT